MRYEDYENTQAAVYAEFAQTVKFVLERAIAAVEGLPKPQSISCRAKLPTSLKPKLQERGLLECETIEAEIKDLAGARIIFYTNNDVDKFLSSRLLRDNFEIDRDATRVHHPVAENKGTRYQAIHYTVKLSDERTKLPEYTKFAGLRCEIQIHTILNHAWSETSHDIYKDRPIEGFGNKRFEAIQKRFNDIMDKYLVPAGQEFARVQSDYGRLRLGKELFDRDILKGLNEAADNNVRYELLDSLREFVLPNYDDIPAIYAEIRDPLVAAVKAARNTPVTPIKATFAELPGHKPTDIAERVIDIFEWLRYTNVDLTFAALCEIYEEELDADIRNRIVGIMEKLAEHNLGVWRQVGPGIQGRLLELIDEMPGENRAVLRPILIAIYRETLTSEISGASWTADAVTLRHAPIPVSDALRAIREKAMAHLFSMFEEATSNQEESEIFDALRQAARTPTRGEYSNELLALTLSDDKKIVEFLTEKSEGLGWDLLESIEEDYLYAYHRAREIAAADTERFQSRTEAEALMATIIAFRDKINADEAFVRFKTLVGFEGVFPSRWENEDADDADEYRRGKIAEYIAAISLANEEEWSRFIERCAMTESEDLATFPIFIQFIRSLSQEKPEVAFRMLDRAQPGTRKFLPAFLTGLGESPAVRQYGARIARYLAEGQHLFAITRHLRKRTDVSGVLIAQILAKTIENADPDAATECVVLALENFERLGRPVIDDVFLPAMRYLTGQRKAGWAYAFWHMQAAQPFFRAFTADEIAVVLENLNQLPRLDHRIERILTAIAETHPAAVLAFLGRRLDVRHEDREEGFQAVPYNFHGLVKPLSANVDLAVDAIRARYRPGERFFRYDEGRLLSAIFPTFTEAYVGKLLGMAQGGSEDDVNFVLAVLQNYEGEAEIHAIVQSLVERFPDNDPRLSLLAGVLENTGVVSGEFGIVNAFRQKRQEITPWLQDPREKVRAFATRQINSYDIRIASEQRSAENDRAARRAEFDSDPEPDPDDGDGNE